MRKYFKDIIEILCILAIIFFIVIMCGCNNASYKIPNKENATLLYQGNKYDILKIDDMLIFVPSAIGEGESREIKISRLTKEDIVNDIEIDSIPINDDTLNIQESEE